MRTFAGTLLGFLAVCGALSSLISAQDKTIVLKAARMFDGREVRVPGLVVVSGAAIVGLGPAAQVPADAQVIDMGDATLSPGFIDAHTHLSRGLRPREQLRKRRDRQPGRGPQGRPLQQNIRLAEKVFFVMKEGQIVRDDRPK